MPNERFNLEKHQLELAAKFETPDLQLFEEEYRIALPPSLGILYSMGATLQRISGTLRCKSGDIWIQFFLPLDSANICFSKKLYEGRYFQFATSGDGEALLFDLQSDLVGFDFLNDGADVLQLDLRFGDIVPEVRKLLEQGKS